MSEQIIRTRRNRKHGSVKNGKRMTLRFTPEVADYIRDQAKEHKLSEARVVETIIVKFATSPEA